MHKMLVPQAALALENNRVLRAESIQTQTLLTMVEQVDAAICACDAEGRMTIVNPRHRELAGYGDRPVSELLGLQAREYLSLNKSNRFFFDSKPFEVDDHPLMRALKGETTENIEYFIQADGQRPFAISASGSPIMVNGEVTRQAMMIAYLDNFYLLAWLVLAMAPLPLVLKRPARMTAPSTEHLAIE